MADESGTQAPALPPSESRHPVPTTSERVSRGEESTTPGGSVREDREEHHMVIKGAILHGDTATLDTYAPHSRASDTAGQTPTEQQEEQMDPASRLETSGQIQRIRGNGRTQHHHQSTGRN